MRYKFSALRVAALSVLLFGIGGCEWMQPRVTSPISGKSVTANELTAEAEARQNQLEVERQRKLDDAAAAVRAAKTDAQIAIGQIQSQQTITAAEAAAQVNTIVLKSQGAIDAANANVKAAVATFDQQIAALDASVTQSLGVIQREGSAALTIAGTLNRLPVVGQALGSAGIDPAAIVTSVLGVGALAWQSRSHSKTKDKLEAATAQAPKKADAAYEDGAKAAAEAAEIARQREHAAWDEATRTAQAEAAAKVAAAAAAQQGGLAQVLSLLLQPEALRAVLNPAAPNKNGTANVAA